MGMTLDRRTFTLALAALALAACAGPATVARAPTVETLPDDLRPMPDAGYDAWVAAFRPRAAARGMRLNIPAGTAVRFEPGQSREVELVDLAGARRVFGFAGRVMGDLD